MAGSAYSSSQDDEAEDGLLGTPTSRMWKGAGPQGGATQIRNKARGLIEAQVMDLLPTTRAQHGEDRHQRIWARPLDQPQNLENALALLPTPAANIGTNGGSQHPDKRRAGNHQPSIQDVAEHVLLPTPAACVANDGETPETWNARRERVKAKGINGNGMGKPLTIAALELLPTPTVGNADGTNERRGGSRSDELLLPGAAKAMQTAWGPYEPAIRRWEGVLGRPAPAPTEPNTKGNHRLSPRFTEWMMGVPEGWITGLVNKGISRNEQLKAAGNGVVPQQAAAALKDMLAAFGPLEEPAGSDELPGQLSIYQELSPR